MAEDIDFTQRVTRPKPTQSVDPAVINRVRRTAVLLGPYRNLTTLTASVLALHPQCQVLNHAGGRLLRRGALDFISSPDEATWLEIRGHGRARIEPAAAAAGTEGQSSTPTPSAPRASCRAPIRIATAPAA